MTKFGPIFKIFLIADSLIEFFFARNGFNPIRNGGADTEILKNGPNLAILGQSLYFFKIMCFAHQGST